jgi:hypothetical protein
MEGKIFFISQRTFCATNSFRNKVIEKGALLFCSSWLPVIKAS